MEEYFKKHKGKNRQACKQARNWGFPEFASSARQINEGGAGES